MALQFTQLRLAGFKSFVEPVEIPVGPGLTAVVGPNGCGKSNIVEALRWVMGENSARRMRGAEMDDVIFAGTRSRPARDVAEVAVHLDNSGRTAPARFNDFDELEVVRRIVRGKGSEFRLNGKPVRARDVQVLFADNLTGAQSPALVEQGRVGAIVNARPTERRALLEGAAGIAGLHSRRQEAEQRLAQAEANLEKLDQRLATLEQRMATLREQAGQAQKYRRLSERIRTTEAMLLYLNWQACVDEEDAARAEFDSADNAVAEALSAVNRATTAATEAEAALEPARKAESEAAAALQRLTTERDGLDREAEQVAQARDKTESALAQLDRDLTRERELAQEAQQRLAALARERSDIERRQGGEDAAIQAAEERVQAQQDSAQAMEQAHNDLNAQAAREAAERDSLQRDLDQARKRRDRLQAERQKTAESLAAKERAGVSESAVTEADQRVAAAEEALAARENEQTDAEERRSAAEGAYERAVAARQEAEAECQRLDAEIAALAAVAEEVPGGEGRPVMESVAVAAGYEAALAAALGEDLQAPAESGARMYWQDLGPLAAAPALPGDVERLDAAVSGPAALGRRLAQVGVVADPASAEAHVPGLAPGQRLVSRDGGLWRWDGLVVAPGAPSPQARRLEQQNRLAALRDSYAQAAARYTPLAEQERTAAEELANARQAESAARAAGRSATRELDAARKERDRLQQARQEARQAQSGLRAQLERLDSELGEAEQAMAAATAALEDAPDPEAARAAARTKQAELARAREQWSEAQRELDRLKREAHGRRKRLKEIADEEAELGKRAAGTDERLSDLQRRRRETADELARLEARPAEIDAQRAHLAERIDAAENDRKAAADRLAEAEGRARHARTELKTAEERLARAREDRVRAESRLGEARRAKTDLAERVLERLDCAPEAIAETAGIDPTAIDTDADGLNRRLQRLTRDREALGPVNLRAEAEAEELQAEIDTARNERVDLENAIARLREARDSLTREARSKLRDAFQRVDQNFQRLFAELFAGGEARLQLTDTEDPLNAGLEIYASPPGKRLQVLSLLSGGERALTAIALLFAVFETNPAPICVLDEVDAPLDDLNVERFCNLVETIAQRTGTRFLLVTHHRLTMSRVNRLFGVTMNERGVSQLVAVDLERAAAMGDAG